MRKVNWFIGLVFIAGCLTTSPLANSIIGKVTDQNGNAIEGAIVTTNPASSSVLTDKDGNYTIRKLSSKEYTVSVTKTGYAEGYTKVRVGGLDYPTQGDIQVLPESIVVEEAIIVESAPSSEKKRAKGAVEVEAEETTTKKKKKWWEK